MSNQDTAAARAYHESTKLCYLDLRNKPPLHKSYPALPVVPLPADFPWPDLPTLDAVAAGDQGVRPTLDLTTLAQLLFFSAGLVRKGTSPVLGELHYRAAASAGALYPVEVYLVSGDIPGLEAGVYHFSPVDFALRRLRQGDYRGELSGAAREEAVALAPATFILTALFWRSAWKYRARSYRYCFWDAGTIAANLLATVTAAGLPGRVVAGFVDDRVDSLLGIHPEREASLCLVPVGKEVDPRPVLRSSILAPLAAGATSLEERELAYPEMVQVHAASSLATEEEVVAWRSGLATQPGPVGAALRGRPGHPPRHVGAPTDPPDRAKAEAATSASDLLGKVIQGRGSTRRFDRQAISQSQLSAILDRSSRGISADFLGPGVPSLLDLYVIVNAVEGLPAGAYRWSTQEQALKLLRAGAFREEAGHLCFEQALGADASAVVFLMADLGEVLGRYGNRGYRAAQLEAGIVGGKIYLCAHALGLGASGTTFYDDAVTSFFTPHAAAKSTMFVVTVGVPAGRNRVRPFRSRVAVVMDAMARGANPRTAPMPHRGFPRTPRGLEEERNS